MNDPDSDEDMKE